MVRIKHRYLVVRFLYPKTSTVVKDQSSWFNTHQPSPDTLTIPLFLRLVRNSIEELFGDYGSGVVAGNMSGTLYIYDLNHVHKREIILLDTLFKLHLSLGV